MIIEGHITYKGTFKVELDMDKTEFQKLSPVEQTTLIENTVDPDNVDYYDTDVHSNLNY